MSAASSYEKAAVNATEKLAPTHPIRLGLALNHSVRSARLPISWAGFRSLGQAWEPGTPSRVE